MTRYRCSALAAACLGLILSGCQTVSYYGQAVWGQARIMMAQKSISEVLNDPNTPSSLKEKFTYVLALRTFAEERLLLPVGRSYLSYADIGRPYVAWNVFAAPELSLAPKTWCYPVIGCASYRGYFSQEKADRYAAELRREGYDAVVRGAMAYSSLGWFNDPVLSTFVRLNEARFSALIIHELAHRMLYVSGDTTFNESFATAVEEEGLRRWAAALEKPGLLAEYEGQRRNQADFIAMIMKHSRELEAIYSRDIPEAKKRVMKAEVMSGLRRDFDAAKQVNAGLAVYDGWFAAGLNNAALAAVMAYHHLVPAFQHLLQASGGDLQLFYRECRSLAEAPPAERAARLQSLLGGSP